MAQYIVRRLVQLILVLIGISAVVFVTMHVLPGDVAVLLLGDKATAIVAYKAFLKLAPSDSQAPTARAALKQLEAQQKASAPTTTTTTGSGKSSSSKKPAGGKKKKS